MPMAKVGIIGGSGLGDALCAQESGDSITVHTPFGAPSDAIIETSWNGVDIAILNRHGPGHVYNPTQVNYRANIYALKKIGCSHIIASGAVGSLRERIKPRDLIVPDQAIDKTIRRVPTFFDKYFAAHAEFAGPFSSVLRKHLLDCSSAVDVDVHDGGTYVCMEGPAFSTRAESEMHRQWGGDLIGMTLMPEAKLAREAELPYAMVCLASDYDCWKPAPGDLDKHELLKEIIGHLTQATENAVALIKEAVSRFDEIAETPCPEHAALELGIWSNRELISPEASKYYGVLVEKYL
ncbi:MAG: S-methyl-5'-thioadenosine phosphorylase [Phycisphaerae bacterium]